MRKELGSPQAQRACGALAVLYEKRTPVGLISGPPGEGWFPAKGRNPSGGKDHFFFCGKRNGPSPLVRTNSISLHPPCGGYPLYSIHSSSPHKSCAFAGPPGRSTGHWYWENGGFRLYALFGDQSRPLRPSHGGTEKRRWFYPAAAWLCHSRGRVRRWVLLWRGALPVQRGDAPGASGKPRPTARRSARCTEYPALREAPAGGGWLGPPASPYSTRAGRNGRKGSSLSYESCWPPFSWYQRPRRPA